LGEEKRREEEKRRWVGKKCEAFLGIMENFDFLLIGFFFFPHLFSSFFFLGLG
jgi:hypothetical protein